MTNYAYIKNNKIVNIAAIEEPTEELFLSLKSVENIDSIILHRKGMAIGKTWTGTLWSDGVVPEQIEGLNWEYKTYIEEDGYVYEVWELDGCCPSVETTP